ncbi:MAG: glutamate--tRNA ligase [Rickettsiaceae bacterium H1]|nr:glutamate--tRNA ligase [Rickettsiaceae bacterium H1]
MLTRFAPSPTGLMHLGNLRTALVCYLYARKNKGKFMLRIDDTDLNACTDEYGGYIKRDLTWLGLDWDLLTRQSERFERYNQVFHELLNAGRIYKCYETAEELEIQRKISISRGLPPRYSPPAADRQKKYKKEGRKPHFRFCVDNDDNVSWNDEIRGEIMFLGANLSDPVVMRTSGLYTYMLPSIIDDIDYGVTHIVRGEDHIANTAIQIQMMKALDGKIPRFAHLSLLKIGDEKLSKRDGAVDVNSLKEKGIEPMAINSYLATIGTSGAIKKYDNLLELMEDFTIDKFSSSSISASIKDIENLNRKIVRNMPFSTVFSRLAIKDLTEGFWHAVKFNVKTIEEVGDWWRICKTNVIPMICDGEFLDIACENLPEGRWNEQTWDEWVNKLKEITGRKGKDLFMPLRLAITGAEKGPELTKLLPLISREAVIFRLKYKNA